MLRNKVAQHGSQGASRNKPEIIARRVSLRRTPFSSTGIPACANVTRATIADAWRTRDIVLFSGAGTLACELLLGRNFIRTWLAHHIAPDERKRTG
jgi:hypothetical protein